MQAYIDITGKTVSAFVDHDLAGNIDLEFVVQKKHLHRIFKVYSDSCFELSSSSRIFLPGHHDWENRTMELDAEDVRYNPKVISIIKKAMMGHKGESKNAKIKVNERIINEKVGI